MLLLICRWITLNLFNKLIETVIFINLQIWFINRLSLRWIKLVKDWKSFQFALYYSGRLVLVDDANILSVVSLITFDKHIEIITFLLFNISVFIMI